MEKEEECDKQDLIVDDQTVSNIDPRGEKRSLSRIYKEG